VVQVAGLVDGPKLASLYEGPFTQWLNAMEGETGPGGISPDTQRYTPILFTSSSSSSSKWDEVDTILDAIERWVAIEMLQI